MLSTKDLIVTVGGTVMHVVVSAGSEDRTERVLREVKNAEVKPVVDYTAGTYATAAENDNMVEFSKFSGEPIDSFPLAEGETLISMAFAPSGLITLVTSQNKLITLTPDICHGNSSAINGYCACLPTFQGESEFCTC